MSDERFEALAKRWKAETGHLSNLNKAFRHPAYREIVAMGPPVVPILLESLRRSPDHWFGALHELTGAAPIKEEHRGRLREMAADWIAWGIENGVIPAEVAP